MQEKRTGPVKDLIAFLRGQPRRNLWFAAASAVLTMVVMFGFLVENRSGYVERSPTLIYVDSWSAARTREQAVAAQRVALAEMRLKAAEGDYARARTALALSIAESDRKAAGAAVARTEAAYMARLEELRTAMAAARAQGAYAPAVDPLVAPGRPRLAPSAAPSAPSAPSAPPAPQGAALPATPSAPPEPQGPALPAAPATPPGPAGAGAGAGAAGGPAAPAVVRPLAIPAAPAPAR